MRVGQHVAFWKSGIVREVSYWRDGYLVGTKLSFHEDGERNEETFFGEAGSTEGSWVHRTYVDDSLFSMEVYEDHVMTQKWTTQESIELREELGFDQIMRDAFVELQEINRTIFDDPDDECPD